MNTEKMRLLQARCKKLAFTLCEVLIVLGIIGIIAEITIPTLMHDIQEKNYVIALKKSYSEMSQAYQMAMNDNGTPDNWGLTTGATGAQQFADILVPYLKITKNCGTATGTGCLPTTYYNWGGTSAIAIGDTYANSAKLQLADGTLLSIWLNSTDCSTSRGNTLALQNCCAVLSLDVNGLKNPNKEGMDSFRFHLTKYGIIPFGTQQATSMTFDQYCKSSTSGTYSCAAWVLYNENEDYTKCPGTLSWSGPTSCN